MAADQHLFRSVREEGMAVKGHEKAFQGVGNVLYFVCGGGYMTILLKITELIHTTKIISNKNK